MDALKKAESYYVAMCNKNFDEMASYVHPNIHFVGPLSTMDGKENVVEAAKNFAIFFKGLTVREKFHSTDSENKVMLVLDFDCPAPIGLFKGASFLTFHEGLISRIELFYDARPFETKKDQIFNQE